MREKINYKATATYSFGGLGYSLCNILVMTYLSFFYTDIFGISPMAVAGLMLASRVVDAVTDPIMGLLSDHTKTRFGKYRPWIIFVAPIQGIVLFLLFTAPDLSATMKVVYAYTIYILYSVTLTMINIPYCALLPSMSKNYYHRTVIIAWKSVMTQTGRFIITVLALPLVEIFGGGKQGWSIYGAIIGIIFTISYWIVAWGAKPYDTVAAEQLETKQTEKRSIRKDLFTVIKVKPFIILISSYGVLAICNTIYNSANMYYFKYVLGREELVPTVSAAIMAAGLLSILVTPFLVKKFDKKAVYIGASVLGVISLAIMWFTPTPSIGMVFLMLSVFGLFYNIPDSLGWSMLPDCVDYAKWKYGLDGNGLITSIFLFTIKVGMALGGFFPSFLLGTVGFVANQQQPEAVLNMITFLRFGLPAITLLLVIVITCFYEITRKRYKEMQDNYEKEKSM